MASALYYIYCPLFSLPISLPPLSADMGGDGVERRTGGVGVEVHQGEEGGDDSTQ